MIALSAVSNHWPFIIGAWGVTFAAVGVYAASLLRRGRRLSQQLPPEERRWM